MATHRHSADEVRRKLEQAEQMTAEGRLQREIADALNVSVMTYHRWRRARVAQSQYDAASVHEEQIRELQLENSRLRKLVTDLLLQKIKLEEEQQPAQNGRNGYPV